MFRELDAPSLDECKSSLVSSRKFQAEGCLKSEEGKASDTLRCFTDDVGEKCEGNGAVNENVEAAGGNCVSGAADMVVADNVCRSPSVINPFNRPGVYPKWLQRGQWPPLETASTLSTFTTVITKSNRTKCKVTLGVSAVNERIDGTVGHALHMLQFGNHFYIQAVTKTSGAIRFSTLPRRSVHEASR